jgi:PKD repeat protein
MNMAFRKKHALLFILILVIGIFLLMTGCTEPPIANFYIEKSVVSIGESVQFFDKSTGEISSWNWDFGDGATSDEQNPVHIFEKNGVFLVALNVVNNGKSSTIEENIEVLQTPEADFTVIKDKVLVGDLISFTNKSIGDIESYTWDFGDGTTSTEENPSHSYSNVGSYSVSVEASSELSSNTQTRIIEVFSPVKADFTPSSTIIETGGEIQFEDNSTGDISSYCWNFGDSTENITEQNPSHKYLSAGNYQVSLTVSNELVTDTRDIEIKVIKKARASFYVTPTFSYSNSDKSRGFPNYVNVGNAIRFADESVGDIDTYFWDFGDDETSNEKNPEHVYNNVGSYTVTLTVSNPAGSDSLVKEDYITVGSLNLKLVMCSSVFAGGIYTPQPDAIFYENDPMVLYIEISGFDQNAVSGGNELWLEVVSIVVATEDRGFVNDMEDLPEIHETTEGLANSVSIGEPLLPYYFQSEYDVRVVVVDRISGNIGAATITYTIQ